MDQGRDRARVSEDVAMAHAEPSPVPEGMLPADRSSTVADGSGLRRPVGRRRLWAAALLAGLVAAVGIALLEETGMLRVKPKLEVVQVMGANVPTLTLRMKQAAESARAVRTFGVFGACLGLAFGLAGGLARGKARSSGLTAAVGLLGGGLAGGLAPLVVLPASQWALDHGMGDLLNSLALHLGLWTPMAAVGGLVFGWGLGDRRAIGPAALGGLVGAAIGIVGFEFLGAVVFPLAETGLPFSTTRASLFLARLFVTLPAALGIALALDHRVRRSVPTP
jgi:hypothetical protein